MAIEHDQAIAQFDMAFSKLTVEGADVCAPIRVATAPGRVNLIGEHTDYSEGLVLPVAIDRNIAIAFRPRTDGLVRLYSVGCHEYSEFRLDPSAPIERDPMHPWSNYFRGVAKALVGRECGISSAMGDAYESSSSADACGGEGARGWLFRGLEAAIMGDIPQGAGLSSSAALEVASAFALLSVAGMPEERLDQEQTDIRRRIAVACQEAENNFVGVKCGIMDQLISVMGRASHAVFLDCRTLSYELAPLPLEEAGLVLVVCDTGVRRGLVTSEYNRRRAEVEEGAKLIAGALGSLEIRTLRDVSRVQFEQVRAVLPSVIARRCEHVISENERVRRGVEALHARNSAAFGALMYESHESLRDLYGVSCRQLDAAVEIARATPGVIGSRMTGGGFGGCTVNLVRREAAETLRSRLEGIGPGVDLCAPKVFPVAVTDGARISG
ncbi:MAG: galactokinase [Clostridia bacterium]|nr:galactokinase [Clostridia bacterium]